MTDTEVMSTPAVQGAEKLNPGNSFEVIGTDTGSTIMSFAETGLVVAAV
jgi:hypothetical protein